MSFSCQLCYFNIENWLSVHYDCRFAESMKLSAVIFFRGDTIISGSAYVTLEHLRQCDKVDNYCIVNFRLNYQSNSVCVLPVIFCSVLSVNDNADRANNISTMSGDRGNTEKFWQYSPVSNYHEIVYIS